MLRESVSIPGRIFGSGSGLWRRLEFTEAGSSTTQNPYDIAQNATINDTTFLEWASNNYAPLQTAQYSCELAGDNLDKCEASVRGPVTNLFTSPAPTDTTNSAAFATHSVATSAASPKTSSSRDAVLSSLTAAVLLTTALFGVLVETFVVYMHRSPMKY
ncbi:hypothetical protein B0H11DRAFT_1906914 [Mycena galericulata]|nr:hypothetical protein B0H11DRAFT_1906914 [Mycena galericulata]